MAPVQEFGVRPLKDYRGVKEERLSHNKPITPYIKDRTFVCGSSASPEVTILAACPYESVQAWSRLAKDHIMPVFSDIPAVE